MSWSKGIAGKASKPAPLRHGWFSSLLLFYANIADESMLRGVAIVHCIKSGSYFRYKLYFFVLFSLPRVVLGHDTYLIHNFILNL